MAAEEIVLAALRSLPPRPPSEANQAVKRKYSEQMSAAVAVALGAVLQQRGLSGVRPVAPGELDASGAERRLAGGIGAKKVDVTWTTEESGLLLGCSIKTINFRDNKTKNYQKNLTNRRGDMLFEAVTLHRRFPYAVLGGFFLLDVGAESDHTKLRGSTFLNAHSQFRLFTGRADPAGREEQFEHLFVGLVEASPSSSSLRLTAVGDPVNVISLDGALDRLCQTVSERNADFYHWLDGLIVRTNRRPKASP